MLRPLPRRSPHADRSRWRLAVLVVMVLASGCEKEEAQPVPHHAESAQDSNEPATPSPPKPLGPEPQPAPPQPTAVKIRLATFNINYGNPNLPAVVEAIQRSNADIVCLQETNSKSAAVLYQAFHREYPNIHFNGTIRPYRAGGFGVLSRTPVIDQRFIPPHTGLFGIHALQVQLGNQPIEIFSVHLQPVRMPRAEGARIVTAAIGAFSKTEKTHAQEIEWILKHVRKDQLTVIAGDFNSLDNGAAPSKLIEIGFVDSFASVNQELHPTWHWPTKFGEVALRIDYIFHTAAIRTLESQVIKTAGSDHYLLVSLLEIEFDE